MTTPETIELKLTIPSAFTRWPCGVCGVVTKRGPVTVEADHDGPDSGFLCCDTCLEAGDLDARLEVHAANLEARAARLRTLIGRLKVPTYAELQAYEKRVDMARHASYCVGSLHGDADPSANLEYDAVMADDDVYAKWRKQLKQEEDDHNRQLEHQRQRRALLGIPTDVDEDFPF